MRNMLVRARTFVLAACALCLAWHPEAQAQSCRRSCKPGEKRDPRGCCIAERKPKKTNRPETTAGSTSKKPSRTQPNGELPRPPGGSKDASKSETPDAGVAAPSPSDAAVEPEVPLAPAASDLPSLQKTQSTPPVTTEPQQGNSVQQPKPPNETRPQGSTVAPGTRSSGGASAVTTRRWAVWKPWALIGVGIGIASAGGILQWRASENFTKYDRFFAEECPRGCLPSDLSFSEHESLRDARSQWVLARAAYTAGGAAVAVGIVLMMIDSPSIKGRGESSSPISIVPELSPSLTGVGMVLRY